MKEQKFDMRDFIAQWYPGYESSEVAALADDLACYIEGQTENSAYQDNEAIYKGDLYKASLNLAYLDSWMFNVAYENYQSSRTKAENEGLYHGVDFVYLDK